MIDPTKGIRPPQGSLSTENLQAYRSQKEKALKTRPAGDEIKIPQETLSLSQAEETSRQTRALLERSGISLGLNPISTKLFNDIAKLANCV
jgi:hypothetical protein